MPKKSFITNVKSTLLKLVDDHVARKAEFVKNPSRDFTRNRKLTMGDIIKATLLLGSSSVNKELLEYYDYDTDTASGSAFTQQRDKISSTIFKSIFNQFSHSFSHYKTFKGYRVLAIDGSALHIPHNPKDSKTYFQSTPNSKGFNLVHINALYDIINRVYIDGIVQMGRSQHERQALNDIIQASPLDEKVLIIGDRGYDGYNSFAHIIEKGWKFLIRVRDKNDKSRGMLDTFDLPLTGEYDQVVSLILTSKQSLARKNQPNSYKYLSSSSRFDFFMKDDPTYPITLRVVKVQIDEDSFQCFVTNLDEKSFPPETIKTLYHMRWGIETSFRELKHTLALTHLHSKKKESIVQEIYAKMTMYNFCSIITSHVVIKKKDRKHDYQVNFSRAISICKRYLKGDNAFLDVVSLIQKYILPIRKGRTCPRKVKFRTFVSFNHRVA